jgi:hypothetical protein
MKVPKIITNPESYPKESIFENISTLDSYGYNSRLVIIFVFFTFFVFFRLKRFDISPTSRFKDIEFYT